MFTLIQAALRSFFLGLLVGLLIAPRSGAETRRLLVEKVEAFVNGLLDVGGLPPVRIEESEDEAAGPTPMRSRRAEDVGAVKPA